MSMRFTLLLIGTPKKNYNHQDYVHIKFLNIIIIYQDKSLSIKIKIQKRIFASTAPAILTSRLVNNPLYVHQLTHY